MLKRKIPFENWRVTRNEIISEMYLESTVRKNQVLIVYGVSTISEIKKIAKLFSTLVVSQCIIYVNSVNRVIDLYKSMMEESFPVSCIHSSMTKTEREKSFSDFRRGASRMLISSNITARGIDI